MKDVYTAWVDLLRRIVSYGRYAGPRGMDTKELVGTQLIIEDAYKNIIIDPQRKLNYRFMVAQWLTTLYGWEDMPILGKFNSHLAEYEKDGQGGHYPSYGPLMIRQWPYVLDALRIDPNTRQAVIAIWSPIEVNAGAKPVPCTLSLQFLLRSVDSLKHSEQLHIIATMRSSDAWLGLPYDIYNFTMLGNYMVGALKHITRKNICLGSLTMNLGSSHLYMKDWKTAESIALAPAGHYALSPQLPSSLNLPPLAEALNMVELSKSEGHWRLEYPWIIFDSILRSKTNAEALTFIYGGEEKWKGIQRTHTS